MALNLSKDYTFSASTTIASAEVNTDFDELYNAFSGLEATTSTLAKLKVDADPSADLEVATKQYVDAYANYRRPTLLWISATTVDVEVNTDTSNKTKIIFPDGNYRSVTEDTSSANKYRRFDITATAEFSSGTEDSGLRSGISEGANTWYAIYAVKSTINTANFVLAGDTTLPLIANVSTLNTRYGTNGWVYLGLIRNGNGQAASSDILNFMQCGASTVFYNVVTPTSVAEAVNGIQLVDGTGATSQAWSYAAGTGAAQVPGNIKLGSFRGLYGATANANLFMFDDSTSYAYVRQNNANGTLSVLNSGLVDVNRGFRVSATNATALSVVLVSFVDGVLGIGSNPFI